MAEHFKATFESLRTYRCPDWFRDVKFGIWSHWGPQSVPMASDWYARNMYIQGSPQYQYHVAHYGHPSKVGYIDICHMWKAEHFQPDELMDLYYRAGARYFMAQATHHDNFFNYASSVNRFNSVNIGPGKDICRMWKDACDNFHLPFGLSEHLAASFNWWYTNKGADSYGPYKGVPYDGNKPEYREFYHSNQKLAEEMKQNGRFGEFAPEWMTADPAFHEYWRKAMHELIDIFQPDLLYSDSFIPFQQENNDGSDYSAGLDVISYLYNCSIDRYGSNQAVYTQKDRNPAMYEVGILDIERSQLPDIPEHPWQTDTCIGHWFYDAQATYKRPAQVIEMLVDIVSKNGCMMLNIPQRPDGTIDDEARYLLEELAGWFPICHEAIYGTRPFRVYKEGPTNVVIQGFTEDRTPWTSSDYRFTQKGNTVYAFLMAPPENQVTVIKTFTEKEQVKAVRLLGEGSVPFTQSYGVLSVKLPKKLPSQYVNCLAVEF